MKSFTSRFNFFKRRREKKLSKAFSNKETKELNEHTEFKRHLEHQKKLGLLERSSFKLGKTLGTGTFGRVRIAYYIQPESLAPIPHPEKEQVIAFKMLRKTEIVRLKQVEHIKSEKAILSQINHPFIVNMHCCFQDKDFIYLVMEYIIGGEMFTQLRECEYFSNEATRLYAAEIILALEFLHKKGIVYRDLKPENLLLDREGHIKITDFGFAKYLNGERTYTLCGTPEYLAPEIIQSKGHDKSVDQQALGVLTFEMAVGYPPFYDEDPYEIYRKILNIELIFPDNFDPLCKDFICQLLTEDISQRLGCMKGGAEDVKNHKQFQGLNQSKVLKKEIKPSLIPGFKSEDDTCNFDEYPESDSNFEETPLNEEDKLLFGNF